MCFRKTNTMSISRLTLDSPIFAEVELRQVRHRGSKNSHATQDRSRAHVLAARQMRVGSRGYSAITMQDLAQARSSQQLVRQQVTVVAPKESAAHTQQALRTESPPSQSNVLVPTAQTQQSQRKWHPAKMLYGMAVILFVLGLGVAFTGFRANDKVAAQVKTMQKSATSQQGGAASAGVLPSADELTSQTIQNHQVLPEQPRYISVPKLDIYARVFAMGVNSKSQLDTPNNIHDAGWYQGSSKPGTPGAMLFDGHSGIGKTNGIFHDAAKLKDNDKIVVTRGDGQEFMYRVVDVTVLNVDAVDMTSMVTPASGAQEGINIITCTGKMIPGTTSLDQRVLVRAVRV